MCCVPSPTKNPHLPRSQEDSPSLSEVSVAEIMSAFEGHGPEPASAGAGSYPLDRMSRFATSTASAGKYDRLALEFAKGNPTDAADGDWAVILELAENGYLDDFPPHLTYAMEQARVHRRLQLLCGKVRVRATVLSAPFAAFQISC